MLNHRGQQTSPVKGHTVTGKWDIYTETVKRADAVLNLHVGSRAQG